MSEANGMFDLTGRRALVTGSTQGIGLALARGLAQAGATVVLNGRDAARLDAAAQALRAEGFNVETLSFDATRHEAVRAAVDGFEAETGPIDILVNNAGITRDGTLHKMTEEQWRSVVDVDLGGCFNMCRAVIEGMRERRFGRIVNISSVNGLSGQFGQTNYAAAKAGVIGFTKALALEGASRNITVNAIAPGYTDTGMVAAVPQDALEAVLAAVPVGRLGTPQEIARGVLYLVEDEAGFVTGATLSINGGKYLA